VLLESFRDNKVFKVKSDALKHSTYLSSSLDTLQMDKLDDIDETAAVPILIDIQGTTLGKIVEYCEYHLGAEQAEVGQTISADEWDKIFCASLSQSDLFDIILASQYIGHRPLLDLSCKVVANMIKGKSPQEIRQTFNIKNDFTPEEDDQVRRENEWCEETSSTFIPTSTTVIPIIDPSQTVVVVVDDTKLAELVSIGFDQKLSEDALRATKNDLEGAINLMASDDFSAAAESSDPPLYKIQEIVDMGFDEIRAKAALKANNNDVEMSVNWLLNQ